MMKYFVTVLLVINCIIGLSASSNKLFAQYGPVLDSVSACDTVLVINGYPVHIVKDSGKITRFGFNLFTEDVKASMGHELLESIERTLAQLALGADNENMADIEFVNGAIADFRKINPQTDCSIIRKDSKTLSVDWNKGATVVTVPISYQSIKGASRSDIERAFIDDVRAYKDTRYNSTQLDLGQVEPYGEKYFVFPGDSYQNKNINRNVYLESDSAYAPIWNVNYPLESISNLFVWSNDRYGNPEIELTVLKHEIGDKETFTLHLNQLLGYSEKMGCIPFWGVEKYENGKLEGALFLLNSNQGYDHIIKVTCSPKEVIEGNGKIEMRASLFVPTNNVNNLFVPYRKKTEKERIRYDK